MTRRWLWSLLLASALVGALAAAPAGGEGPGPSQAAVPGEVLVKLKPGLSAAALSLAQRLLGPTGFDYIEELHLLRLRAPAGQSAAEALRALADLPQVEYAEPNYRLRAAVLPNDQLFGRQRWYFELMQVPEGWEVERGEPSVVVAVLDTGIDRTHPDLVDRIWRNPGEVPDNGLDDDGNGCPDDVNGCTFLAQAPPDPSCPPYSREPSNDVNDDYGHGTFVAGVIAAEANNRIGLAGIAPGVTLLPVKVLDCTGSGNAMDAARGLLYAAEAGARIANLSFGSDDDSRALGDAIRMAHDQFGMVLVAAAGNEGAAHVTFPASLPEVIAVGGSARADPDARASFSNWGPEVDVAAPSEDIVGPVPAEACDVFVPCIGGQPYGVGDGTSFATPQVVALAALVVSHTPSAGPERVWAAIQGAAQNLPDGNAPNWDGAGRIRVPGALRATLYRIGAPGVARN